MFRSLMLVALLALGVPSSAQTMSNPTQATLYLNDLTVRQAIVPISGQFQVLLEFPKAVGPIAGNNTSKFKITVKERWVWIDALEGGGKADITVICNDKATLFQLVSSGKSDGVRKYDILEGSAPATATVVPNPAPAVSSAGATTATPNVSTPSVSSTPTSATATPQASTRVAPAVAPILPELLPSLLKNSPDLAAPPRGETMSAAFEIRDMGDSVLVRYRLRNFGRDTVLARPEDAKVFDADGKSLSVTFTRRPEFGAVAAYYDAIGEFMFLKSGAVYKLSWAMTNFITRAPVKFERTLNLAATASAAKTGAL